MGKTISEMILAVFGIILMGFGLLLAVIGVFFINKLKKKNNQLILLINLSLSEGCLLTLDMSVLVCSVFGYHPEGNNYVKYLQILQFSGFSFVFYQIMLFITLDRLICVLTYKHKIYATVERIKFALTITWIIGVSSCVPFIYINNFINICLTVFITFDIVILLMSTIVFTAVLFPQHLKRGKVIPKNRNKRKRTLGRHLVPFLIIITFTMFYTIPDFILMFVVVKGHNNSFILQNILFSCWRIGLVLDPIFYLLLHKQINQEVRNNMRKSVVKQDVERSTITSTC